MRKAEINRILGKVDEMAISVENVNIPFVVGEVVKVIDGPFNSFDAEIEAIDEQRKTQVNGENFWKENTSRT